MPPPEKGGGPGSEAPEGAAERVEVHWLSGEAASFSAGLPGHQIASSLGRSQGLPVWARVRLLRGGAELPGGAPVDARGGPVTAVVATPRLALSGGGDALLRVWNLDDAACLGVLSGHTGAVVAAAVCFARLRAVSGALDGTLRVWDLGGMACTAVLTAGAGMGAITAVAADFTSGLAINCCQDRAMYLWALGPHRPRHAAPDASDAPDAPDAGARLVARLCGHALEARAVAMCGGQVLSGSSDRTLRLWELPDMSAGRQQPPPVCRAVLEGHSAGVRALSADFARGLAASAAADRTVRLWDLALGACTAVLQVDRPALSIAADFDCCRVWSSAGQGVVKVWDQDDEGRYSVTQALTGHAGRVTLAMDVCRGHLVSGGEDGSLSVWELKSLERLSTVPASHRGPVQVVAV